MMCKTRGPQLPVSIREAEIVEGTPLQHRHGRGLRVSEICMWFQVAEDKARIRVRERGFKAGLGVVAGSQGHHHSGWGYEGRCGTE